MNAFWAAAWASSAASFAESAARAVSTSVRSAAKPLSIVVIWASVSVTPPTDSEVPAGKCFCAPVANCAARTAWVPFPLLPFLFVPILTCLLSGLPEPGIAESRGECPVCSRRSHGDDDGEGENWRFIFAAPADFSAAPIPGGEKAAKGGDARASDVQSNPCVLHP